MIEFTVYPGKDNIYLPSSSIYWKVCVYANRQTMLKRYWQERPSERGCKLMAAVLGHWGTLPSLGYALFNKQDLTQGIVAHEAFHMSVGFVRQYRKSVNLRSDVSDEEERIGDTIHICVDQIAHRLKQLGITIKVPE